jgi:hypothetical protein
MLPEDVISIKFNHPDVDTAGSSELLPPVYRTTQRTVPEDVGLNIHLHELQTLSTGMFSDAEILQKKLSVNYDIL